MSGLRVWVNDQDHRDFPTATAWYVGQEANGLAQGSLHIRATTERLAEFAAGQWKFVETEDSASAAVGATG